MVRLGKVHMHSRILQVVSSVDLDSHIEVVEEVAGHWEIESRPQLAPEQYQSPLA